MISSRHRLQQRSPHFLDNSVVAAVVLVTAASTCTAAGVAHRVALSYTKEGCVCESSEVSEQWCSGECARDLEVDEIQDDIALFRVHLPPFALPANSMQTFRLLPLPGEKACCADFQKGKNFDGWLQKKVAQRAEANGAAKTAPWSVVISAGTGAGEGARAQAMFTSYFQHLGPDQLAFFVSDEDDNGALPVLFLPKPSDNVFHGSGYNWYQVRMLEWALLMAKQPMVDYKWLVLADDDTFVFPRPLASVYGSRNPDTPAMIGTYDGCAPICGGAGILVSRGALLELSKEEHLKKARQLDFPTWYDSTLGMFMQQCVSALHSVVNDHFSPAYNEAKFQHKLLQGVFANDTAPLPVTFHYVKPQQALWLNTNVFGNASSQNSTVFGW